MALSSGLILLPLLVFHGSASLPDSADGLSLRQALRTDHAVQAWYHDLNEARAESVKSGLPLVLHFEASWCGACQTMSRRVLSQPQVSQHLGRRVIGVKVDADQHPNLLRRFHIAILPSDVFLDADGRLLASESGYRDLMQYEASLERLEKAAADTFASRDNPNVKLGPEALRAASSSDGCVIVRRAGVVVGLGGYSPVAMKQSAAWVRGNRNYAAVHRGVMYYMQDADELRAFQADPSAYAPKLHGCDPVVLTNNGRALPGKMALGAFVDGHLYFFATEASRALFKKSPRQFIGKDLAVSGRQLQSGSMYH